MNGQLLAKLNAESRELTTLFMVMKQNYETKFLFPPREETEWREWRKKKRVGKGIKLKT